MVLNDVFTEEKNSTSVLLAQCFTLQVQMVAVQVLQYAPQVPA